MMQQDNLAVLKNRASNSSNTMDYCITMEPDPNDSVNCIAEISAMRLLHLFQRSAGLHIHS